MATQTITDDEFDAVIAGDKPVLIDFWAEWCGPCKQMAPHLDAVAADLEGTVTVAKINVDENPMSASRYGVRGLPTLMLFKNGKMVDSQQGALSRQRIAEWVKEHA